MKSQNLFVWVRDCDAYHLLWQPIFLLYSAYQIAAACVSK